MEDSQIINLFFKRDKSAISVLQNKYGTFLYNMANNILKNAEDSNEIVNDTLLKIWNSIPPAKPENLKAYIIKITRNLSFNRYKHLHTQKMGKGQFDIVLDELNECIPDNSNPENEFDKNELSKAINSFLSELPREKRQIFILRYFYATGVKDIAKLLDFSPDKISVMLNRLRKQLKQYLNERDFDI